MTAELRPVVGLRFALFAARGGAPAPAGDVAVTPRLVSVDPLPVPEEVPRLSFEPDLLRFTLGWVALKATSSPRASTRSSRFVVGP